jgi:imidazole glycerol-phosphate synthase subunit HisH
VIAVVDSGVANLASVMAALQRLGAEASVTSDAAVISGADRVILPGVGAAAAAMAQLEARRLIEPLRSITQPLLGICLGMQLLFASSTEGGEKGQKPTVCLGIIPGQIDRLPSSPETPVPHMGWNQIKFRASGHPLLRGVDEGSYVYFVHSYAAPVTDVTIAVTEYGLPFASMVGQRNFFGCQFHPERSSAVGSQILQNFLEM